MISRFIRGARSLLTLPRNATWAVMQNAALLEQNAALAQVLTLLLEKVDVLQREQRLMARRLTLPPAEIWSNGAPGTGDAPGTNIFPCSVGCRQEMFDEPYFGYWTAALGYAPRYHRKLWEFVFILQALHERGAIVAGARGLGFGVGEEPLAAYFASRGCKVLGTDMAADAMGAAGWSETGQHAQGKAALRNPGICPDNLFDQNVDFRTADMNAIPEDLTDFDFCWSACALEHVGSIEKGLAFIENSLKTLRPGGLAIHTTELNVSSNDDTIDNAGTVLFRRRDMEALVKRLEAAGHQVAPLDFAPGQAPLDQYIDLPPYADEPHLKLALAGYVTTSFGIIVRRGA